MALTMRSLIGVFPMDKIPLIAMISRSNRAACCVSPSLQLLRFSSTESSSREIVKPNLDDIDRMLEERTADLPSPDMDNPYKKEEKVCILCKHNVKLDYKNTKLLSQFISQHTGMVYNKNITGLCAKQYERVVFHADRARQYGYMPYVHKDVIYLRDSQLIGSIHTPIRRR